MIPMEPTAPLKPMTRSPLPNRAMTPSIIKLSSRDAKPFMASNTPYILPCSSSSPCMRMPFIIPGQKAKPPARAISPQIS
jgi:hypothetical protein